MGKTTLLSALAVSLALADPQGCPTTDHSVTSLPYWNSQQTLPCSYAGTLASSADGQHNLFYWLFRNPASQNTSAFTIWLNGGPGSSSLFGLFNENGPLRVTRTGAGPDDFQIGLSPEGSWFDLGDILFIDQPVGTGFSYTNSSTQTYLNTMDQVGDEFIIFLTNFKAKYPDYGSRPLTFSGESYAGKYLPFLSTRIVQSGVMNLTNVVLGNPYTSPVNQRTSTWKVGYSLGIIDSYNRDQVAALQRRCERAVSANFSTSGDTCTQTLAYVQEVGGGIFDMDARLFNSSYLASAFKKPYQDYFNTSGKVNEVFAAIHVDKSPKVPVFEPSSDRVAAAIYADQMIDYSAFFDSFTNGQSGPNFLVYAGQWDNRDGPVTIESWITTQTSNFKASDLYALDRQIYYVNSTANGVYVGGYFRRTPNGKFTLMTVPKAGHYVPRDVLEVTKSMVQDMQSQGALQCHNTQGCSTKQITFTYMNYCSGHGSSSAANGECQCDKGWAGADCSKRVEILSSFYAKRTSVQGALWTYFSYDEGLYYTERYEFIL